MKPGDKVIWNSGFGYDIGILIDESPAMYNWTIELKTGKYIELKISVSKNTVFIYSEELIEELYKKYGYKKRLVTNSCMVCGTEFEGEEPKMCCSGRDCGCMGMPVEPIVCSSECYEKLINGKK